MIPYMSGPARKELNNTVLYDVRALFIGPRRLHAAIAYQNPQGKSTCHERIIVRSPPYI